MLMDILDAIPTIAVIGAIIGFHGASTHHNTLSNFDLFAVCMALTLIVGGMSAGINSKHHRFKWIRVLNGVWSLAALASFVIIYGSYLRLHP